MLHLPATLAEEAEAAAKAFPLLVPHSYLGRMRPADPDDPLLRQILPRPEEFLTAPGFTVDPVGEQQTPCDGVILKKYHGRALLVVTGRCAVHCRFCFRRHFPYSPAASQWFHGLASLAAERSIREVILSGGDPLMLDDAELAALADAVAQIPHVQRLRVHSRLPIMAPDRVNDALLGWLRGTRLTPSMVVHVNHPAEVASEVATALGRLVDAGVPVYSQSVLLRGVNDRAEVLEELYTRLVDLRVTPYYLHQLDRVAGAAHFEVPMADGRSLVETLRARLPGYAVPRYVQETPGATGKSVLA